MGFELIPLFFGAGAFALIAWGARARRSTGGLPQHWLPVTGRVVDAEPPQLVSYLTPNGRRVQLRGTLDPSYVVGQEVAVLVDPVDSTRARLVEADRAATSVARTLLILGVVSAVAAVLSVIAFG